MSARAIYYINLHQPHNVKFWPATPQTGLFSYTHLNRFFCHFCGQHHRYKVFGSRITAFPSNGFKWGLRTFSRIWYRFIKINRYIFPSIYMTYIKCSDPTGSHFIDPRNQLTFGLYSNHHYPCHSRALLEYPSLQRIEPLKAYS